MILNTKQSEATLRKPEKWEYTGGYLKLEVWKTGGAPYLAKNYTWSEKREEEQIKNKTITNKKLLKIARVITAGTEEGWAWIHINRLDKLHSGAVLPGIQSH